MLKRLFVPLIAVLLASGLFVSPAGAGDITYNVNKNLNNVASNSGSLLKPWDYESLNLWYYSNPKTTETAYISCGSSWGFMTSYITINANDHTNYGLGFSQATCYQIRQRTPGSSSWWWHEARPNNNDY